MKIIIIGTAYPYRGGLAAYNERLARQFTSEGHDVSIITFTLQYPGFLFPGKTQYIEGKAPEGLKIERRINSINPFNWILTGYRIKKQKPDIVIFKYWLPFMAPCFGTISRIAHRRDNARVICIFDNVIPHEKRPGDRLLTRYFTSSIDGAIAMSASVLKDLSLFRNDIPSALNPHPLFDNFGKPAGRVSALEKLGLDPSFKYLLFFGFVRAYKGLDLLLEAFSSGDLRNRGLKLIVAGEFYEDAKPYHEIVNRSGIADDVIFFERFINDDEVSTFFSAAELVIQPYRDATQSGVTQIAYHFEKPMIVTDVGGLREIVPDRKCGYVVKPAPAEITAAIIDYLDNDRSELYLANIREEKKKYSWNLMTGTVINIFKMITGNDNKK
ncbi:MAG: glycosyltransferase [Bacteroidales bacterium]|jgi:glycosyltransferase involved in cell wall biosynthesis